MAIAYGTNLNRVFEQSLLLFLSYYLSEGGGNILQVNCPGLEEGKEEFGGIEQENFLPPSPAIGNFFPWPKREREREKTI